MSAVALSVTLSNKLRALEKRLDAVEVKIHKQPEDERSYRSNPEDTLVEILSDACTFVRRVERDEPASLAEVVERVSTMINRGLNLAYGGHTSIDFVASFAHETEANLLGPPLTVFNTGDVLTSTLFTAFASGGMPFRNVIPGPGSWKKDLQPKEATSLSRFRRNVNIPPGETYPTGNLVFQARCEVKESETAIPIRLALSSAGSCLALIAAGGYKDRDPYVHYWSSKALKSKKFRGENLNTRLAHVAYHIATDEDRKLVIVADKDRIKSFNWEDEGEPVHTMNSRKNNGPIAVLPGGRLLRAGAGTAMVWNVDDLSTHKVVKGLIGEGCYDADDTSRDIDDPCEIEESTGSKSHTVIKFKDATFKPGVWHYHKPSAYMLCGEDTTHLKKNTDAGRYGYSCLSMDMERGQMVSRYLGHGGYVSDFSTSDGDANIFATAASDGYARIYDMRQPLPQLTMNVERQSSPCGALALAHPDGLPVLFTGGKHSESIHFWDLRAKRLVYELATGNNSVNSMVWDSNSLTLYAATECNYVDRLGNYHGYRPYRRPSYGDSENNSGSSSPVQTSRSSYRARGTTFDDDDDDEEMDGYGDEDMEDSDEFGEERCWPKGAIHEEDYFGYAFDGGEHRLYRYGFKGNPNLNIVPVYGQATCARTSDWY
ncbi:hypothetical protein NM688_g5488 [Phlebia brevispora]|uniref:Uncharacterized protein n=1 Tax=Phlebia brevispora TaxID=194682 RepID=A0ACC1SUJ7_9APHY|nr:hypothetical protein NM688_g5488 [Phlebia brevispora]